MCSARSCTPSLAPSVCTQKCCCKINFTPCFDLVAQRFVPARVRRTEVGLRHWAGGWDVRLGMGSGLPGLGRTQARARTESQLSHRGPCPSSRSFFLDTENSIFAHKFKVPSSLPHFSIISHWELRSWFPYLSFYNSKLLLLYCQMTLFSFYLHNSPDLGCSLSTKPHHVLLEIPP